MGMWAFLARTAILLLYFLVSCALLPMFFKRIVHLDNELVRKGQHIAYAASVLVLLYVYPVWWEAVLASFTLVAVAWPVLKVCEKKTWYRRAMTDRLEDGGELRESLVLVQVAFVVMIVVFWGILGETYKDLVAVSSLTWGFGDAAAALFGKRYGKTRIRVIGVDKNKTFVGSNAMTIVSFVVLVLSLLVFGVGPWWFAFAAGAIVAPGASALELYSKQGHDTIVVPVGTATVLAVLVFVMSSWGWF
jgi:phytol kinase